MSTYRILAVLLVASACAFSQSDGDGIPDAWKKNGVDVTWPDGRVKHLDLPGLGVQAGRKAVVVWVDWMEAPDHTHRPVASSDRQPAPLGAPPSAHTIENAPLQRVVRSFLGSGVDDRKGVTLAIIWADKISWPDKPFQPIPEQEELGATYKGSDNLLHYDWTEFDNIRKSRTGNFSSLFGKGFHYAAFIHRMKGLSNTGLSKMVPGDEFLVSLGALNDHVGSAEDQCGTFMHELGHNLGLNHGGADDIGYKPNYLSVMNYLFQRVGIANLDEFGHFDYSKSVVDDVDESKLSAKNGISVVANLSTYGTAHVCNDSQPITLPPCAGNTSPRSYAIDSYNVLWHLNCPVDWKCAASNDGTDPCPLPSSVESEIFEHDVNGDGCISVLKGYDDWSNLQYWAPAQPAGGELVRKEVLPTTELDATTPTLLTRMMVSKVRVSPVTKGIEVSWSRIPLQRVIGYEVLRQGPSGRASIIKRTTKNEFVDETTSGGVKYLYSVRPVFAISAPKESQPLIGLVRNAVLKEATILEQRARRLHLLPPGIGLVRGQSTPAARVVAKKRAAQ